MEYNNCPACNSKEITISEKSPFLPKDPKFKVASCNNCKISWSEPMPSEEDLMKYYSHYYKIRYNTVDKNKLKVYLHSIISFHTYRLKRLIRLIEKYSPNKNIIDFGCGESKILQIAKSRNWNSLAIDYSNELEEFLTNKFIKFIRANSLDDAKLNSNYYGCIIFLHVLEHIPELKNLLKSARKYLTSSGIIVVKSPSATSIRAKTGTSNWHLVNPPEHMWGFDKNNFKKLLENLNFEVLYIKDSLIVNEFICIAKLV